jgi:hypothetical protein
LNMPELHLQPHPSKPKEWFGVASINTDEQPAPSPTLAMTFVKVNWNNNTVSFQGEGTSWITIPIGGTLNTRPRIVLNLRPAGLSNVRGRYEVWANVFTSRSGKHPCDPNNITNPTIAPPPIYGTNTTPTSSDRQQLGNYARGFAGQDLVYLTITPDFVMGPVKNVSSDVRPMPSDHNMAMEYPHRADVPNGFGLYSGSLHQGICTQNLIDYAAWSTSGILFTNLVDLN